MIKNNKIILGIGILLLVLGSVSIYFMSNKKYVNTNVYKGTASIISSPSFKYAIALIKDTKGNEVGTAKIYSNVFWVNEEVKVEYTKNDKNLSITKIEISDEEEETTLVNHLSSDVTIRNYRELVNITVNGTLFKSIWALPEKISNQIYDLKITPINFFQIKYKNSDLIYNIEKDLLVTIDIDSSYQVLSLRDASKINLEEEIPYTIKNNKINFTSNEAKVYSLKVKFDNGNIINYIF